ncbi:MAG: hypothetical protein Rubg2KO_04310 [Rubricoccaceae bacterium]
MSRSLLTTVVLVAVAAAGAAVALRWGSDTEVSQARRVEVPAMEPEVLVVMDGSDPYARGALQQTEHALETARIPYRLHDVASRAELPDLDGVRAVITAVEKMEVFPEDSANRLEAFVESGGGLVVAYRGWSPRLASFLGLATREGVAFDAPARSVTFHTALMPGGDAMVLEDQALSSYAVQARPECDIVATRGEAQKPTVWMCARGEGRVVYWNAALLATKPYRGFLLQSLAAVYPDHVRPVSNWAVIHLDDFPSPASNGQVAPIWNASKQTPAQFYAESWYPDMRRLADRYGLTYTSSLIFAYNDRTRPPFPMNEWLAGQVTVDHQVTPYSPWITVESAHRDEMGLHGYNHQSLLRSLWGTEEAMAMALRAARDRWAYESIAPMPRTYVPPMNRIDSLGVAALHKVFPEVESIAGLYVGDFDLGQNREFGPEPWNPEIYALPRVTAGFILTDRQRLLMLSVLQTVGAWNHFVHPDEVFANPDRIANYELMGLPPPGEIGWYGEDGRGFYPRFEAWVQFVRRHYPWLEFVKASDATQRMRQFDDLDVAWEREQENASRHLTVHASHAGQVMTTWARPHETLESTIGAEVLHTWKGPFVTQVVFRMSGTRATLAFAPTPS